MNRREFLACVAVRLLPAPVEHSILVHEHILVDFTGAEKVCTHRTRRTGPSTSRPHAQEL